MILGFVKGSNFAALFILTFMQKNRFCIVLFTVLMFGSGIKILGQAPDGYGLVWSDEFNDARTPEGKPALRPDKGEWWYETGGNGWGNSELQYYVAGTTFYNDTLAAISDGTLKIKALKKKYYGMEYVSIRMNTSKSWTYGYFETRAKLPGGKGVWPAFWMMPKNFQSWPLDGEIDIMEYVGYDPNVVHASVHTEAYNHKIGTQKTSTLKISNAETEFHVYGLDWTETRIRGYVDGVLYFTFSNDGTGNKKTWPFNAPFYLKLNLAIGGSWGGVMGVDTQIFPSTYEIDYVRVFQQGVAIKKVKEEILSGEAHCLANLNLQGAQSALIEALAKTGKPLVTVVIAGRPLTIGKEVELSNSVLYSFHPGTMGGPAIADLLFGKAVPSGKTPVTFPKEVGQIPVYYGHENTGRPANRNEILLDSIDVEAGQTSLGNTSFYLDAGFDPLYPFGFGLSYTTFKYEDLKLSSLELSTKQELTITFNLKNTGNYTGTEIAQLYVRDKVGSVVRPVKELKRFTRVTLKPGESKTVTFLLPVQELAFWNIDMKKIVEPGEFTLWVGTNSQEGISVDFRVLD